MHIFSIQRVIDSTRYGTFQAPIPLATTEHSHASFPSAYFFIQCPSVKRLQYHNFEVLDMIRTTPPLPCYMVAEKLTQLAISFQNHIPVCLRMKSLSIQLAAISLPPHPISLLLPVLSPPLFPLRILNSAVHPDRGSLTIVDLKSSCQVL